MILTKKHIVVINLVLFSFLLLTRLIVTKSILYAFLTWNIFLASVPWIISSYIHKKHLIWKRKEKIIFYGTIWLLFFPNAPYIITDLFHLQPKNNIPLWFDLTLLLSAAWTGLLMAYYSLRQIDQVIHLQWGKKASFFCTTIIIFISSFGIYLGRYLRWNSWDIIVQPIQLIGMTIERLTQPSQFLEPWSMIFIFGLFLCGLYWSVKYSKSVRS